MQLSVARATSSARICSGTAWDGFSHQTPAFEGTLRQKNNESWQSMAVEELNAELLQDSYHGSIHDRPVNLTFFISVFHCPCLIRFISNQFFQTLKVGIAVEWIFGFIPIRHAILLNFSTWNIYTIASDIGFQGERQALHKTNVQSVDCKHGKIHKTSFNSPDKCARHASVNEIRQDSTSWCLLIHTRWGGMKGGAGKL